VAWRRPGTHERYRTSNTAPLWPLKVPIRSPVVGVPERRAVVLRAGDQEVAVCVVLEEREGPSWPFIRNGSWRLPLRYPLP